MCIFIIALLSLFLLIYCINRNKTPIKSIGESKMEERTRNHRKRMIVETSNQPLILGVVHRLLLRSSSSNRSSHSYDDSGSYGGSSSSDSSSCSGSSSSSSSCD